MILISHRGNINGKIPLRENEPSYIRYAMHLGYNVEVDVWYNNGFWLGHDEPTYPIGISFLKNKRLWCHVKNVEALSVIKIEKDIHYFWHETDTVTLTSQGYIWAYPGKQPIEDSIAVMPEIYNDNLDKCIGICSDYIKRYK